MSEISYWHWLIAMSFLFILELILPGMVFMWLALAAAVMGLLVWLFPDLSLFTQLLLFALVSIGSLLVSQFYINAYSPVTDEPLLNRRGEQYVGRVFTLPHPIKDGTSRAALDDSMWKIYGPDCPAGTKVRVTKVESISLKVEPLPEKNNSNP